MDLLKTLQSQDLHFSQGEGDPTLSGLCKRYFWCLTWGTGIASAIQRQEWGTDKQWGGDLTNYTDKSVAQIVEPGQDASSVH